MGSIDNSSNIFRILIVGGGIAGLASVRSTMRIVVLREADFAFVGLCFRRQLSSVLPTDNPNP